MCVNMIFSRITGDATISLCGFVLTGKANVVCVRHHDRTSCGFDNMHYNMVILIYIEKHFNK